MPAIDFIKPVVRSTKPYTLKLTDCQIKVNQNENPYDMPQEIKDEVARRVASRPWSRYPAFVPTELQEALAAFAGWRTDGILAGNGSNELIQALFTVTIERGVKVLLPEPTFTLYRLLIEILGGEVIPAPLTEDLTFDLELMKQLIAEHRPQMIVLCSPNNPTGCAITEPDLRELLNLHCGILVLDEAYVEFADWSAVKMLEEYDNLIILRTFSKALALAGLRVGYLLSNPALATEIAKAKLPYNINFFSITAAIVAMERYESILKPIVATLVAERERLYRALSELPGIKPYPSCANFILTRTEVLPPVVVLERLLERGILVRDVSRYPKLSDCVRISCGRVEENNVLISALREIVGCGDQTVI